MHGSKHLKMYEKCTTEEIEGTYTTESENLKLNCLFGFLDIDGSATLMCTVFILCDLCQPSSGSLSPRHGASSGCG